MQYRENSNARALGCPLQRLFDDLVLFQRALRAFAVVLQHFLPQDCLRQPVKSGVSRQASIQVSATQCYMCDAAATSVEHVPPRCLFPEQKDLPKGLDLRKQLITVPSCNVHNTSKSQDDEYLLYALSMNIPNNPTASGHFSTKVLRAIQRRPSLIGKFAEKRIRIKVEDTQTGEVHETLALQVDRRRLEDALKMIGCALYFHHFKTNWKGTVSAYPHFLLALTEPNARELNEPVEKMAALTEEFFINEPRYGENQDVFSYQVATGQLPVEAIMLLRFYEGSRVTLLFRNGG